MIVCYEGTPGSGKTYDSVRKISDNLKLGRVVYTNIDGMELPECKAALQAVAGLDDYQFANQFKILLHDQVGNFWEHCENGALIVLDEIHKWFNAREWNTEKNKNFSDWASTHRHYNYDVVLITQRIEKIDSQVRSIVEYTYRYKKIGFFGGLVRKSYIVWTYTSDDTNDPISKSVRFYDSRIFKCYQSFATKDSRELGIQKAPNILKHPVFLIIPVVLFFTICMFTRSSLIKGDLFGAGDVQARVASKSIPNAPPEPPLSDLSPAGAVASSPAPQALPPDALPLPVYTSDTRRLVGVIDGKMIYKCGGRLCD